MVTDLDRRRDDLEREFFGSQDRHMRDRIRSRREPDFDREALVRVCGVRDEEFIEFLLESGACPESVAALVLPPMVVTAWADGRLSASERGMILDYAEENGILLEDLGLECR